MRKILFSSVLATLLTTGIHSGYAQTQTAAQTCGNGYVPFLQRTLPLAQRGDKNASYAIGMCMVYGDKCKKDISGAKAWLQHAASLGDQRAKDALVNFENRVKNEEIIDNSDQANEEKLRNFHERAKMNDVDAQFALGVLYHKGFGVPANMALAKACYQSAADQGHLPSLNNLGLVQLSGVLGKPDYRAAVENFARATQGTLKDNSENPSYPPTSRVMPLVNLAIMYSAGQGVELNLNKAEDFLTSAFNNGFPGYGRDLGLLGITSTYVFDVYQSSDPETTISITDSRYANNYLNLLQRLADKNNNRVNLILGQMYYMGSEPTVKKDITKSIKYLENITDLLKSGQPDISALLLLASIYADGTSVPRNKDKAFNYYRQAFDLAKGAETFVITDNPYIFPKKFPVNEAEFSFIFAKIFEGWSGFPYNEKAQQFWLKTAAKLGHSDARQTLCSIEDLDPETQKSICGLKKLDQPTR